MLRHRTEAILTTLGLLITLASGALLVSFHAPLQSALKETWLAALTPRRTVYHFVAEDCRCSGRLMDYLLSRGPADGFDEVIVFIGQPQPVHQSLIESGFTVRLEASPAKSGILAAPWLVVREPGGQVTYSGGYEPAPRWEQRILFNVQHRLRQASLPSTGCTTSRDLRAESLALRLKGWFLKP